MLPRCRWRDCGGGRTRPAVVARKDRDFVAALSVVPDPREIGPNSPPPEQAGGRSAGADS